MLDHLLQDDRFIIEGISGASAGALNAVMVADGLARGGPEEARKRLGEFWQGASIDGGLPRVQRAVLERLFSFLPVAGSPAQAWFDALSQFWSPYDLNPLNINPLKDLIERFVDFEAIRNHIELQLFISATNVQTGRLRIFGRDKISADVVMASACLPLLFKAVDGQSGHLPVFLDHRDRGRAAGSDQSAGAASHADIDPGHHEPNQRDHV